jgi:CMP-N-acetylneuraminic acid synthetase
LGLFRENAVKVLGLIPARGGSKGIPRKSIKPLAGKPLLEWTAEAALASRLDRVILSSDNLEIIEIAKNCLIEVPFVRPEHLAGDYTPAIDVVCHAVQTLKEIDDYMPDAVMLLQPTSPLRTAGDINRSLKFFEKHPEATSLVSVVKVPHNMIPESLMKLEADGYLKHLMFWDEKKNIRQEKPTYYARNGAAIYIVKTECLLKNNTLYGDKILAYEMSREKSIDIDDYFDFEMCEFILRKKK